MNGYDDIYCESEADKFFLDATSKLMDTLTQKVKDKISRLEVENEKLQGRVTELINEATNVKKLKAELLRKEQEIKRRAQKVSVEDFMGEYRLHMFKAKYSFESVLDKCDKCDDNRDIHYKSPRGKEHLEPCWCAEKVAVYNPEPIIAYEISKGNNNSLHIFYREYTNSYSKGYTDGRAFKKDNIYIEGASFLDYKEGCVIFQSESDCQRYCDWLNKKTFSKFKNEQG